MAWQQEQATPASSMAQGVGCEPLPEYQSGQCQSLITDYKPKIYSLLAVAKGVERKAKGKSKAAWTDCESIQLEKTSKREKAVHQECVGNG